MEQGMERSSFYVKSLNLGFFVISMCSMLLLTDKDKTRSPLSFLPPPPPFPSSSPLCLSVSLLGGGGVPCFIFIFGCFWYSLLPYFCFPPTNHSAIISHVTPPPRIWIACCIHSLAFPNIKKQFTSSRVCLLIFLALAPVFASSPLQCWSHCYTVLA